MKSVEIVTIKQIKTGELRGNYSPIRSPQDAADILFDYLDNVDREYFIVMCLDTKNQVNQIHTVSIGTLNSSLVHPREVFKVAYLANSSSIIVGHNHPSGDPFPSSEDKEVTKRLQEAGSILGIELLDHIVIGDGSRFYSFKQKGDI